MHDHAPNTRGSVLVVDHSDSWRNALARDVGALGYPIVTASTAFDALAHIDDRASDVECVFVERGLPEIDGPDLVSFLAVHYPHVRCILVDASADTPATQPAISKPWTRLSLVCALAP